MYGIASYLLWWSTEVSITNFQKISISRSYQGQRSRSLLSKFGINTPKVSIFSPVMSIITIVFAFYLPIWSTRMSVTNCKQIGFSRSYQGQRSRSLLSKFGINTPKLRIFSPVTSIITIGFASYLPIWSTRVSVTNCKKISFSRSCQC